MRMTSNEVETLVLSSLSTIETALVQCDETNAEQVLDWCVFKLWDHSYFSASYDLIDKYKNLYSFYIYGA
jgi:hypothetical protein